MKTLYNLLLTLLVCFSFNVFYGQQPRFFPGDPGSDLVPVSGGFTHDGVGRSYTSKIGGAYYNANNLPLFHPTNCNVTSSTFKISVPQLDKKNKKNYKAYLYKYPSNQYHGFSTTIQNNLTFVGSTSATTRYWDLTINNVIFQEGYIYVAKVEARNKNFLGAWNPWGFHKLTQTVFIGDCDNPCFNNYIILDPFGASDDELFEAINSVTGENIISSGANVRYDAGAYVDLVPGFHAKAGSNFTAYIDGCGGREMRVLNSEHADDDVFEDETKSELKIYPNPSSNGKITIDLTDKPESRIQIYALDGRLVKDTSGTGKVTIDLSYVNKGMYQVKITLQEEIVYKKVIIN